MTRRQERKEKRRRRYQRAYEEHGVSGVLRLLFTPPRKLIPTKAGWIYFGFMLLIVAFAYTTNNNLLFLLFSAMLVMMIFSGLLSEASLGDIDVQRDFPPDLFAKRPFPLTLTFLNRAKRIGAYAFGLRDAALFEADEQPFMVHLPAGGRDTQLTRARLLKRGEQWLPSFKLETQYPFLLFSKTREVAPEQRVLVYPALVDVSLEIQDLFAAGEGEQSDRRGEGDAICCVREYNKGDPLRRIDWKKSAYLDELFVKEYEENDSRRVAVLFDPQGGKNHERGLETAASLLLWLYTHRLPFYLAGSLSLEHYDHRPGHLRQALSWLARYSAPVTPTRPDKAERILEVYANGDYRIR